MRLRAELWNDHIIRFVDISGKWYVIGFDVATALEYKRPNDAINQHVEKEDQRLINLSSTLKDRRTQKKELSINTSRPNKGGSPVMLVISEFGIYELVFSSKMKQAREFKRWVYTVIQKLRKQVGLDGFQVFRLMDKQAQKEMMCKLDTTNEVDYIKANTITNKAVSNLYGLPKMIGKKSMTPAMLKDRPSILNDVVDLMNMQKRFGLDISISKTIYEKVANAQRS